MDDIETARRLGAPIRQCSICKAQRMAEDFPAAVTDAAWRFYLGRVPGLPLGQAICAKCVSYAKDTGRG